MPKHFTPDERLKKRQRVCVCCGAQFLSVEARSPAKHCSKDCRYGRAANLESRKRVCVECGAEFVGPPPSKPQKYCSSPCRGKAQSRERTGWKQTTQTIEKRRAKTLANLADPEFRSRWLKSVCDGMAKWMDNPDNAHSLSAKRSANLKAYYQDAERSAERRSMSSWVMKAAGKALRTETNYPELFAAAQARLRAEHPFNGQIPSDDYYEYCRMLGTLTVNSPECRALADSFMSDAIPRFTAEWQSKKPVRANCMNSAHTAALGEGK